MSLTYAYGRRMVARVYDPESDIDYLFDDVGHAQTFFDQLAKYNSTPPLFFEMDI